MGDDDNKYTEKIEVRLTKEQKDTAESIVNKSNGKYTSLGHFTRVSLLSHKDKETGKTNKLNSLREYLKCHQTDNNINREWFAAGGTLDELHYWTVRRPLMNGRRDIE